VGQTDIDDIVLNNLGSCHTQSDSGPHLGAPGTEPTRDMGPSKGMSVRTDSMKIAWETDQADALQTWSEGISVGL